MIAKSASSIGANYREANRARSNNDFKNKIKICESEASETVYWIEVVQELDWIDRNLTQRQLTEAKELLAIFTSISSKMKSK